jgi:hypothetical protein
LLVCDLLHPVHDLAVKAFLDSDMGHARWGRCAVPVLLVGREPDHVTWPDLLDRTALTLDPAAARRDDQRLTQRMRMPRGAGAWFERDAGTGNPSRVRRGEQAINAHSTGEVVIRAFAGRLGAYPFRFPSFVSAVGYTVRLSGLRYSGGAQLPTFNVNLSCATARN